MKDDFLLNTPLAVRLYQEAAETLPIIDYHNHLCMEDLAENRQYRNLAELWLLSDPYKHRAMRICGVEERYITGDAPDMEKFRAWMNVLPALIGNPLYDWSVMEMKRIFGIDLEPGMTDPDWLWEKTGKELAKPEYSACRLLERFQVEYAAPCALITEKLSVFEGLEKIAPSLRADNLLNLTNETVKQLEQMTQRTIDSLKELFSAIRKRLDVFERAGCKFSDHALDNGFIYWTEDGKNEQRFALLRQGKQLDEEEKMRLSSAILYFLSGEYAKRGWTMQLHIGAQRYTSSRLRTMAGPAGGFAGIGNSCNVVSLTKMLDEFEQSPEGLPQTLLFTLNPADNALMSVLSGSYSQDKISGKVQQGPAWWWCDHLYGMREVFENISTFGVLSVFIGMTTDSRSILSFVRHEYFRRALCGWIGEKVQRGEITAPEEMLKKLVRNICYANAAKRIEKRG